MRPFARTCAVVSKFALVCMSALLIVLECDCYLLLHKKEANVASQEICHILHVLLSDSKPCSGISLTVLRSTAAKHGMVRRQVDDSKRDHQGRPKQLDTFSLLERHPSRFDNSSHAVFQSLGSPMTQITQSPEQSWKAKTCPALMA